MKYSVEISGTTLNYYHRDLLRVVMDCLASAGAVSFGELQSQAAKAAATNPAGWIVPDDLVRVWTLGSDLYVDESRAVRCDS